MSTQNTLHHIRQLIVSDYSFLYLTTWEENRWGKELSNLSEELDRHFVSWSVTQGAQPSFELDTTPNDVPPENSSQPPLIEINKALSFLDTLNLYPAGQLFVLRDFHPYLDNPSVIRKLRDLSTELVGQKKVIVFLGPVYTLPVELEKDMVHVDLPLPQMIDLIPILDSVLKENTKQHSSELAISNREKEKVVKTVLGLTEREARKAMQFAFHNQSQMHDDIYSVLVGEKRRLIRGSDLLEFYDLDEGIDEIGGLDLLKIWLTTRGDAFSEKATQLHLPTPKGVLLLGVQGCGKSLTARATAKLLSFPLLRLDVGGLLSGERGGSEKNMREALKIAESIAPVVLWLDEIEKGFSGLEGNEVARDGTLSRIFGSFLTWMQDRKKPVFVVATANSVTNLPPELLRRGRFDELFFIDLPNYEERKDIFRIHLSKRNHATESFDIDYLARKTDGYSGAEIEQAVISAMYETYHKQTSLNQRQLLLAVHELVPLSVTMQENIFNLREWARTRCRLATPDNRVVEMLEEEDRLQVPLE